MKLENLRKKIDKIDEKILKLLQQRAKEVIKINQLKEKNKLEIYSPEREQSLLNRLKKLSKGPFAPEDIEIIFREILSVSRALKKQLKVVYLGPQGTFTYLAAIKQFGRKVDYIAADSINDVFEKVERYEADYGVVPIENSIEGVVNYTLDMFFSSDLKICAEITLNISHVLLARSSTKIERIYSNPQVFAQCRKWIAQNYPKAELVPVTSTAKAAIKARSDNRGACIGNKILAQLYGLKVIASSIQDNLHNYTRFLVISQNDSLPSGKDKTSILFSVKDRVGILHDVLASFKKYKINLTKIESRPSKMKPWEYYFFVDFEGHRSEIRIQKALNELQNTCIFVKILGSYPKETN
ncbi:MAG: prephenate dehydratase [Candidatus Omnitrophica bacterium]|nr:prephenate dehydratase [Candidatus Omnitrophota bacterium]